MYRILHTMAWSVAAVLLAGSPNAGAQSVEEFYRGKTITLVAPFNPGGISADFATYVEAHMPEHIPGNPDIVVEFMPGGGGLVATNHFFNKMPRDGTSLIVPDQSVVVMQHMDPEVAQYDAAEMNWIGIAVPSRMILMVRKDTGVENLDDLKEKEVFIGASSVGSETYFFPMMTNRLLGTKMNVVPGFPGGSSEVMVAVESGEMHGSTSGWQEWKIRPQVTEQMNPIVMFGGGREPALPDLPNVIEFVEDEEEKKIVRFLSSMGVIGRGLATTPDVPQDRIEALRAAFDAMVKDPDFQAQMAARGVPVSEPMTGAEATEVVREALSAPPELIARARELIAAEQ